MDVSWDRPAVRHRVLPSLRSRRQLLRVAAVVVAVLLLGERDRRRD